MAFVKGLKKNTGGLWTGVFQGLAYIAPAATAASFFVVEAGYVGASVPLTFLLATLGVASAMYMNYEFSKRISHAGGYYSYISAGLGGRFGGFASILYYTNVMGALVGFSTLFFAGVAWPLIPQLASNPYGWLPLAFIPLVLIFTLLYFGLRPSLYYTLIGGVIEVGILIAFSLFIILSPATHNSFAPFSLNGISANNLGFGTLFAILGFVGLGSIITISEELETPKKVVPKAIVYGLIIGAITYVISSYALVVGWGITNIATFSTSTNPGFTVISNYLGPIGLLVFVLITLNSFISNGIAEGNAFSRIGYGMARDNLVFPKSMAVTDKKTGSPRKIVLFEALFVSISSIVAGLIFGPFIGATIVTALNGSILYVVHILSNFSLPVYGKNKLKFGARKWVPFLALPLPATVIYLFAIYGTFAPFPPAYPYNYAFYLFIFMILVGIVFVVYLMVKKTPEEIRKIGSAETIQEHSDE
ncbi:APC family permease [Oxyplasma meridianum]|uniref:APC family permease n=1 Tax=Oxyplasma meridianum TaxID=3073602 RepID=A0AAX4NEV2_9ARCH